MMRISLDPEGSLQGFEHIISEAIQDYSAKGLLILSCDGNGFSSQDIDPIINNVSVPLIGGIFPAIFHNGQVLERGTLVAGLSTTLHVQVLQDIESSISEFTTIIDDSSLVTDATKTMFVFVDGLSFNINSLIDALFDMFGLEINYIGGGAGSLSFEKKPCLFTNNGLVMNSALLATTDRFCGIGVGHGLKSVSGPHRITETQDNKILSLDWQPAYQYFKEISAAFLEEGENDSFPLVSRYFSLGINRLDDEKVVREAAFTDENGSLVFSMAMSENTLVDLLKSDPDLMIRAAQKAKDDALDCLSSQPKGTMIIFDCCCRKMFLGELFSEEIKAIKEPDIPMIGALTIGGEIANTGKNFLEYYNRTCVVGLLED